MYSISFQEAYSVARQFNLIPPIAEQAEYHLFQREKVELHMPELYHKIGMNRGLASGVLWGGGTAIKCNETNNQGDS